MDNADTKLRYIEHVVWATQYSDPDDNETIATFLQSEALKPQ
jgi:hypothetical protein